MTGDRNGEPVTSRGHPRSRRGAGSGGALDTVKEAGQSPEVSQPYAELGLAGDEYSRVRGILGRRPTAAELAVYAVMWSEHCSYKSSKPHLRRLGENPSASDVLLAGIGENAGVVDVGGGYAVTFKMESHNHPSYVEPYQGAATGVGGIVRDVLAMGARPIGVLDSLRFGPAGDRDTARVLPGVVAGVGGYGNCLGLPNVGGEVVFDPCYARNPLVNALCVGVLRRENLTRATAPGAGNQVILFGARTGGDGIGGVSVLASAVFQGSGDDDSSAAAGLRVPASKRPSVQVGDPFLEKVLVECCLQLSAEGLLVGIQDLGGAGLSCALTELAAAGAGGMHIDLDRVPLRDTTLAPEEVLCSESQERMCAIVAPDDVARFLAVCAAWDVPAAVLGEVTEVSAAEAARGGRLVVDWHGETIVDVPPRTVAHEGPVYHRPYQRPAGLDALQADDTSRLPRPSGGEELRETVVRLAASPNLCSKRWVTSQYDRYVQGNTVLAPPDDAGVLRLDESSGLGVAIATDGNGRYVRLDPYEGARLALAEAYRNVAVTGARPLAVTDCLNFGSPEDPGVMWQFAETVRGLADACAELRTPVTGGNVSFYNQTGSAAIHPTPVVGVLGVLEDVRRRVPMGFAEEGAAMYLLGTTRDELGGSEWAHAVHGHLGGRPPRVDLGAERALAEVLVSAASERALAAAHDLSEGGLAQALVESCLRYGYGCRVRVTADPAAGASPGDSSGIVPGDLAGRLPGRLPGDPFVALFSESAGRAVVASLDECRLGELCAEHGVPYIRIGTVGGDALDVEGLFSIPLAELREAHESTLPRLFG